MSLVTHRSYSQVKQLRECGYQYKLERIDGAPSRPGAANVAGTAVHVGTELVDHFFTRNAAVIPTAEFMYERALEAALVEFDKELARYEEKGWPADSLRVYGWRPKMDIAWYRTTGVPNSIKAYVDWRFANPQWVLAEIPGFGPAIEIPFDYYIGDQSIRGAIDRVFTTADRDDYCPFDIKSGKPPATDEQLGLYAAALRKGLGWKVSWGYFLHNLRKGEAKLTRPLSLDHWNDETLAQVYLPATQLIDLGIYIPSPGSNCEFCGVADACPFSRSVV